MTNEELKAWRLGLGLSQDDAADRLDVTKRTYQRYEAGERPIPASLAILIASGLDASAAGLVSDMALQVADPVAASPTPARPAIDPIALGWTPARTTHTVLGASASWDTREPKPGWKRIPGCIRVVHEAIPDPLPFDPPARHGPRAVLTASGAVYDQITGRRMQSTTARRAA